MAKPTTLLDKVSAGAKTLGGGQSVQQLASQAGLAAAPLTAYGTGMIGGSPQQAKMAGVPAQKQAALTQAASPKGETQLEQAQTFQTAGETPESQNKKQLAGQYVQALGTFGAKVNEWVEAAKQRITGQTAQVQVDASDALLAGLDAGKKTQATDLLKQIATTTDGTTKNQLELQLNNILGKDVNSVLNPEQKAKMYQDVSSSIQSALTVGQAAVTGADRKITLSDFNNLGTTPQELATLLGVPPEEVGGYSLSQLQNKISEVEQREFGTTKQIQAGLSSGVLSSTDRAALRQYLRGVEQTGVAGAEAGVASLAHQIDQAQQVTFAGKSFTVDELLASSQLNDLFKTVMDEMKSPSGTGPNTEVLKKDEPGMYNWLVTNQTAVQKLIDQSVQESKSFGEMQTANKAALGVIADKQPELAKKFGYDPNTLRAEAIDPAKLPGVFKAVGAIADPGQRENAAAALSQLTDLAGADKMKGLSADQVTALQPGVVGGPADTYIKTANAVQAAQNHVYIEDIIKDFSSGDELPAELNDTLTGDKLAAALGLPQSNAAQLDVNKDGKIDQADAAGIKSQIKANLPSLDLVAKGQKPTSNLNSFKLQRPVMNADQQSIYNDMKNVLADGFFTQEEADALPWSEDKMRSVYNNLPRENGRYIGKGGQIAKTLEGAIERKKAAREYTESTAKFQEEGKAAQMAEEQKKEELKKAAVERQKSYRRGKIRH